MNWTSERKEETDEGGNVHQVIVVSVEDGRLLRYSPNFTEAELTAAVSRDLAE